MRQHPRPHGGLSQAASVSYVAVPSRRWRFRPARSLGRPPASPAACAGSGQCRQPRRRDRRRWRSRAHRPPRRRGCRGSRRSGRQRRQRQRHRLSAGNRPHSHARPAACKGTRRCHPIRRQHRHPPSRAGALPSLHNTVARQPAGAGIGAAEECVALKGDVRGQRVAGDQTEDGGIAENSTRNLQSRLALATAGRAVQRTKKTPA